MLKCSLLFPTTIRERVHRPHVSRHRPFLKNQMLSEAAFFLKQLSERVGIAHMSAGTGRQNKKGDTDRDEI